MQLHTQRLLLRELASRDLNEIHKMNSFPEVDQYNTLGLPESITATEKLLRNWLLEQEAFPRLHYVFCIMDIVSNTFTGMIGLRLGKPKYRNAEVWYKLFPDHWGKGYATEALKELLRFGFQDINLHRIEAGCAVENIGSIKVLEKAGMIREGRTRKLLPIRGEWMDNYGYAILEEDYIS
ncbi:MAG: GNAT family protein [Taibaiella sp.]|jgi:RimJ/RimL family protein N-acetyltransferase